MYVMDWALIGYAIYVPLLIGVYLLELAAIFKFRKTKYFNGSFHRIFVVLAVVSIAACAVGTFVFRLPIYPIVNRFYEGLTTTSPWLTAAYSGAYYLNCLSEFLGVFLAFNHFSTLYLPVSHDKLWRWLLPLGVLLCVAISFIPVFQLFDDSDSFVKSLDPKIEFTWYFLQAVSSAPKISSIWFNMVAVTLVSNVVSSLLYAACIYKLYTFSVTKHYRAQRNFFLVGFSTMLFSLPFMIAMARDDFRMKYGKRFEKLLSIGLNLPFDEPTSDADLVTFMAFQLPWLTDLKYLSPAPMLLITNYIVPRAIKRIFSNSANLQSNSKINVQIQQTAVISPIAAPQ